MTVASPVVSIVVLNFNGRDWLDACLSALIAQRGAPAFEIILVDNASSDGSAAFVRDSFPAVRVHEAARNLGFAAGNNAGARLANGGMLAFLNNDTVAESDWLSRLYGAVEARREFGLATSRIVSLASPSVIDSAGDGYLRAGGAYKRGHGAPAREYGESREVFGACGAAFLIDRRIFESLRGFDEAFFMVYEDVDLSYRARLMGHRCWYAADAIVRHAGSATLGRASDAAVFYGQRNLEWTWIKNTPRALLWRSLPQHVVYSAAGLLHYARIGRLGAAMRGKMAALGGLGSVLKARRAIQSRAKAAPAIDAVLDRGWLALKRTEKATSRLSAE